MKKLGVGILYLSLILIFNVKSFSQTCSGTTTLTTTTGNIEDGSGSNNYSNGLNCKWLIQPVGAATITLTFADFSTEGNSDFVKVYNGTTTTAPLLGSFSGTSLPGPVTATSGSMLIQFTSDGSVSSSGWSASYTSTTGGSSVPVTDFTANLTSITIGNSILFTDASSNQPTGWHWTFQGGTPSTSTQANPTVLYNSSIGNFDVTLIASNAFGSDTMIKPGYIKVNEATGPCSGTLTINSPSGTFSDGSGIYDYYDNSDCKWLIQPTGASIIGFRFNSIDVNSSDYIKIYDGPTTSSQLIGTYSGTAIPPVINSTGGSLLVNFVTDGYDAAAGWEAMYCTHLSADFLTTSTTVFNGYPVTFNDMTTHHPTTWLWHFPGGNPSVSSEQNPVVTYANTGNYTVSLVTSNATNTDSVTKIGYITVLQAPSCTGTTNLNNPSGSFSDGSGSDDYTKNLDCKWLIQPMGAVNITLTFTAMNTELNSDVVRVYDGASTSSTLIGSFSGTNIPSPLTSSGGSLLIEFITDGTTNGPGWSANYTCTLTSDYVPVADFYANDNSVVAGSTVTFSDVSSNIPTSWLWTFEGGTPGSSTEQNPSVVYNSIGNYDVKLVASNSYGSDSITKSAYIGVTQGTGACSGTMTITSYSGNVSDGSGIYDYYDNSNCYWLIEPQNATKIGLQFTSFSVDPSDHLYVYDGPTDISPLLGNFTGTTLPPILTSSGNSMLLHFVTDAYNANAGWEAFYSTKPVADFTSNLTTINAGQSISFSDNSTGQPSGWSWEFPGGTPSSSTVQNPTVSYYSIGIFNVKLKVTNYTFSDSVTKNGYIIVNMAPYCYGTVVLTDTTGTITDGSGTNDYNGWLDCGWLIQPPGAVGINLTFNSFSTQQDSDVVSIYDGPTTASALLGSFSGNTLPGPVTSTSGSMLIKFNTDLNIEGPGWEANYSALLVPAALVSMDKDKLAVVPNPNHGAFLVKVNLAKTGLAELELETSNGICIYKESISSIKDNNSKEINITGIASGIYILRLITEKEVIIKKIIIE